MKGFKCESNVGMFSDAGDSAGKYIFNLLKAFNLRERTSVLKRITIIKTRVYERSSASNGSGKTNFYIYIFRNNTSLTYFF